jgi:hypothetical protein
MLEVKKMETVEQRASNLASFWYGGGKPEEAEEDLRRKVGLAKMIEKALREQDKLTRHAIAEALAFHSYAHSIAMNTSAL